MYIPVSLHINLKYMYTIFLWISFEDVCIKARDHKTDLDFRQNFYCL